MSEWIDRIENHQVHTNLQQIKELLTQIEHYAETQADSLEDYNRLSQIISFVCTTLANTDSNMVPNPTLNNLASFAQKIIQELANYNSNRNRPHLVNANNHADNMLIQSKTLLMPSNLADVEGLRESVGNFRKSAGQFLRYLEEDFKNLKTQVQEISIKSQELNNEISVQKGRLDTAITQFQQQFSDSAEKRREDFAKAEKERNDLNKEALANFEVKFEQFSNERKSEIEIFIDKTNSEMNSYLEKFNKQLNTVEEKSKAIADDLKETSKNQIESLKIDSEKILTELSEKKKEASDIVQIIGNIGVTGNFQRIANQEKKAADYLRILALILMVLMVFVIGLTIFISAKNGFDWKLSLFRIGAALILAIPATYAASESSKHRIAEYRNRQAELELASIDPFLEKMPDDTKHELKAKLTDRFFGCVNIADTPSEKVSSSSLFDLIKMAVENLTKK